MAEGGQVTELLRAYEAGDREAFNRLVPLVYQELRGLARAQLRRERWQSLTVTGLVNEAYLKLAGAQQLHANDRDHLLAVAACAMRQVLIGRVRARMRAKRGGGEAAADVEMGELPDAAPDAAWLLDLDRALEALRQRDQGLVRVFECRFFAGMSEEETGQALGLPLRTVQRSWMRARAWLRAELGQRDGG